MKRYAIAIYKANGNYSAHVIDVDGCIASGKTVEEVTENMRQALEYHFEAMAEDSEKIPEPEVIIEYVDVAVPGESTTSRTRARPRRKVPARK